MKESKPLFARQVVVPAVEPVLTDSQFIIDNYDFLYFASASRAKVYQMSHRNPEFFSYSDTKVFSEYDKYRAVSGKHFRQQLWAHIEYCKELLQEVDATIGNEDGRE